MGQRRVVLDLTEYQARVLRMAVNRLNMVAPARLRTRVFSQKLAELVDIVREATEGLAEIGSVASVPLKELPRRHPAHVRRNRHGKFSVR